MPFLGGGTGAAMFLNSAANIGQYLLSADPEKVCVAQSEKTVGGVLWAASTGAAAGYFGAMKNLRVVFDPNSAWLTASVASNVNRELALEANVTAANFLKGVGLGIPSGFSP